MKDMGIRGLKYLAIFLMLLLVGCSISPGFEFWHYEAEAPVILSIDEAHDFCWQTISYVPDNGDVWQLPHETLMRGAGDCEDFSLLFMFLIYKNLGIESHLVRVDRGILGNHFLVRMENGRYYDPMVSFFKDMNLDERWKILDVYNYGRAMFMALIR